MPWSPQKGQLASTSRRRSVRESRTSPHRGDQGLQLLDFLLVLGNLAVKVRLLLFGCTFGRDQLRGTLAGLLTAGEEAVVFLLRQIAVLQAGGQPLDLSPQAVRLSVLRQLVSLLGERLNLILHFNDVVRLELVKDHLGLGIQLPKLFKLGLLLPSIRHNGVNDLLERPLYL